MKHVSPKLIQYYLLVLSILLQFRQQHAKEMMSLHQSQSVDSSSEEINDFITSALETLNTYDENRKTDSNISFLEDEKVNFKDSLIANTLHKNGINTEIETNGNNSIKNNEFETKLSGSTLDEFVNEKLGSPESGNTLPIFLTEPESAFVVKNRPATLKCKAAHALQLHFKCSGSSQPPPSSHDKHVDPHTGTHLEEVTATIHRDLVDEYFGKGPFKCECHAWSSRGVVKSRSATVDIAYIRKQFITSPTSLRVEIGTMAELKCEPPSGFPEPKITWLKNNVPINELNENSISILLDGVLTFRQLSLQDMANYTCSAENIAGKRISESAVLIVYINGGWSSWSAWKECKCVGKVTQGRKRIRSCSNPIPLNGGSQCSGPQVQKSSDCIPCPEDTQIVTTDGFELPNKRFGRWSAWSEWSSCSNQCIQTRRRKCLGQAIEDMALSEVGYSKPMCAGKDVQTAECRGEQCHVGTDDFDWTLYLGLAFITAVFFAFGSALICCAKRGITSNPHYNMTRTVMDSEYIQGVDKKEMRMHIEAVNAGYDYVNPSQAYLSNDTMLACPMTEHHYDVPNLSANYTNPIDELSVDYLTDTGESSTGDSSKSSFDGAGKYSNKALQSCSTYEFLSSNGGRVGVYGDEIMLYIPEMAIGKSMKKHVALMLLSDDSSRISIPNSEALLVCSSIVYCAPRNYNFLKPVILKIPHCLNSPEEWNVKIYHADHDHDDLSFNWRKIITVGEETINTPVFVQLEPTHVFIMTEQLGRFVVVADPKLAGNNMQPSIKMRLFAFNQLTPSNSNNSLRVYVVKDFPNSKDICRNIEEKLGGTYLGESESFAFYLNNSNLNIRVCSKSTDWEENHYEQIIPYNHILSSNSILHCEFSIRSSEQLNIVQKFVIEFTQSASDNAVLHSFCVSSQGCSQSELTIDRQITISIDGQGNYVNETALINSLQLPSSTKRLISVALDPPRADERDWRMLAKMLGTDRYIAYFATKPSPTEQILNLWECRASSIKNTIVELLLTLKEMERQDVMDIIVETMGPMWI